MTTIAPPPDGAWLVSNDDWSMPTAAVPQKSKTVDCEHCGTAAAITRTMCPTCRRKLRVSSDRPKTASPTAAPTHVAAPPPSSGWWQASDGNWYPPQATTADPWAGAVQPQQLSGPPARKRVRASMISGVAIVSLLLTAGIGGFLVTQRGGTTTHGATSNAATTPSLATKTTNLAATLTTDLCGQQGTSVGCTVDGSVPGVIQVTLSTEGASETSLRQAGAATNLWSAADVARMVQTRAIDGMQRSADSKVTWTYYPDNGLNLVITVT